MGQYSNYLHKRVQTRGPNVGFCAICRNKEKLSRDHIPPESCGNYHDMRLYKLFEDPQTNTRTNFSQGGFHFKTLCQRCNNTLLGGIYDKELSKFCKEVASFADAHFKSKIAIPEKSYHFTKPNYIAKSIIGHLLASNAVDFVKSDVPHTEYNKKLAEYVLDPDAKLPDGVNIYYWLYPYRDICAINCFGLCSLRWRGSFIGGLVKFAPLAFWILSDQPDGIKIQQEKLAIDRSEPTSSMSLIQVKYNDIPHKGFPERPTDTEMILSNSELASIAIRK